MSKRGSFCRQKGNVLGVIAGLGLLSEGVQKDATTKLGRIVH